MKNALFLLPLSVALAFANCKKDDGPCATYETDIKPIVEKTCSYAGCHSGATAGAWVPAAAKDYTTFDGLKAALDNGKFKDRVLVQANMPNPAFVSDGHPKSLTQEEKDLIDCWLGAGYPQK